METPPLTKNQVTFRDTLARHYVTLFSEPDYAYSAARNTPEGLAAKMTTSLIKGDANKDGEGIKRTCKELNIPYTYKGLAAYFGS